MISLRASLVDAYPTTNEPMPEEWDVPVTLPNEHSKAQGAQSAHTGAVCPHHNLGTFPLSRAQKTIARFQQTSRHARESFRDFTMTPCATLLP